MLDNLYPDVVLLAGGGQTPSCPVPPISPAPPPDYRALLRHPDDFEFSVNGCCVRIWNAAGCLGSVDNQHFGGFHAIKRHLPQALAMAGCFCIWQARRARGCITAARRIWTQPKR